ncbi:MAG: TRAP transporter substrate-binding protein [Planctomycetes bacterium]|nr:TRAP transporter substrate-binding protein [Planctomycetota bacterium]
MARADDVRGGHRSDAARIRTRIAAVLSLTLLAGCERAGRVRVIKLGHGLSPSHTVHKAMLRMAELVERKSGGTLRIEVFPSQQLGTERECLELLQIGSLGMTKVSAAVLEAFAPAFKAYSVPYLFRDDAHRFAVLDGPIGREILLAGERYWLRGLCYYDAGSRSFYTVGRPVRTPEDLVGLKIRTQESPTAIQLIRALGGSATPIAWGELYTALQQGVVDGAENNPPSFHLSRHYEVCKYYSINEHTAVPDVLLISTKVWDRLTGEQRRWLQEAADESAIYQRGLWKEATEQAMATVAAAGVEIIHPDKSAFAEKVKDMDEVYRGEPALYDLIQRIRATGTGEGRGD